MSYDLDYFPPKGSAWKWHPKKLNYSPWGCNLSDQMGDGKFLWPLHIAAFVDLKDGKYNWRVEIIDWQGKRSDKSGTTNDALSALKAAEKVGEEAFKSMMPDWTQKALSEGWRPPAGN